MYMEQYIKIHNRLSIPEQELRFRFSRSGGPGGQHVNKAATKVELLFDVRNSPSLSDSQRKRIEKKYQNRISTDGILRIEVQDSRSQLQNRQIAIERFRKMLADALKTRRRRISTSPPQQAKEKRLKEKKKRGEIKKLRRRDVTD